jgi:hypothetical protein
MNNYQKLNILIDNFREHLDARGINTDFGGLWVNCLFILGGKEITLKSVYRCIKYLRYLGYSEELLLSLHDAYIDLK